MLEDNMTSHENVLFSHRIMHHVCVELKNNVFELYKQKNHTMFIRKSYMSLWIVKCTPYQGILKYL